MDNMTSKISLIVFCALFAHCCAKFRFPEVAKNGCGWRNENGVGSNEQNDSPYQAKFGEFPWTVAILYRTAENDTIYNCVGSLITPQWILTTAYCVQKKKSHEWIVRGGSWNITNEDEKYVDRPVMQIIIHEKVDVGKGLNDIALLKLKKEFPLQDTIQPICLSPLNATNNNGPCYATGWGKYNTRSSYAPVLKKIDMPIVPNPICQNKLRKTKLSEYFILNDLLMCAGGEKDKDLCTGDSGAPLVCPIPGENNRYYQVGINTVSIGCGSKDVPRGFVNMQHAYYWIKTTLSSRQEDTSHFMV